MTEFKKGDKVTVKSWEATVVSVSLATNRVGVQEPGLDGYVHYYLRDQLKKHLPYEDGHAYISAAGTIFTFHAEPGAGGYWRSLHSGCRHSLDHPMRPMRAISDIGPEIKE